MGTGMTTYRVGQRVRIEWPDGSAVEGVLRPQRYSDTLSVVVPRAGGGETMWQPGAQMNDGRTVTILSEPRPEEPTGLGSVVEARVRVGVLPFLFVRVSPESGEYVWRVVDPRSVLGNSFYMWSTLIDPVVKSEGWKP